MNFRLPKKGLQRQGSVPTPGRWRAVALRTVEVVVVLAFLNSLLSSSGGGSAATAAGPAGGGAVRQLVRIGPFVLTKEATSEALRCSKVADSAAPVNKDEQQPKSSASTAAADGSKQAAAGTAAASQAAAQPAQAAVQPAQAAVEVKAAKPVPPLPGRESLPALLQTEGFTSGAELGVLIGEFAEMTLRQWPACKRYYLVDLWDVQENYKDLANAADKSGQEQRYQETKQRLEPWQDKTTFLRMYTTEAAKKVPDGSLDYVYVDARHDYCGVMEDLVAWYPKLRSGGLFAGHDYIDAHHQLLKETNQDWSVCGNGTVNWGAVKGAVDDFARSQGLNVSATTDGGWASWMARKP